MQEQKREKKAKAWNNKTWVILFLALSAFALLAVAGLTAFVDPYFHFHKPVSGISYQLSNERYQNYGIAKTFDYDAVIVGTSMSENFKPSQMDAIYGVTSVKLPFSGGSHCEVRELLEYVFTQKPDLRCVVRNIDLFRAFDAKDDRDYPLSSYPVYLYDDNPWNDVGYLLNFQIFAEGTMIDLARTVLGKPTMTLDEYANWMNQYVFGPKWIQANYSRNKVVYTGNGSITDAEYETIRENFQRNVIDVADEHPNTTFYLYVSPYSIYFFDYVNEMGELDRYLAAQEYILKLLVGVENVRLYAFYEEKDLVTNPYNYRDVAHHHEDVNSQILAWMKEGHGEITSDNLDAYLENVWEFYHTYDYDSLFEEDGFTIKEP